MKAAQAQAALAALSSQTLAQAYARLTGSTGTASRSTIIQALAVEVVAGRITLDQIGGMKPVAPQATPATPAQAPDAQAQVLSALIREVERLEKRIQATQQTQVSEGTIDAKVAGALYPHQQAAQTLRATVATLEARLAQAEADAKAQAQALTKAQAALTPRAEEVRAEVLAAAQAALAPFLTQVQGRETEVAQAIGAPITKRTALEVFGIDARDARGREMLFDVYTDPLAPPVDTCFIWTERIVRRLFLAQSTGRNCWLGGPAGTGKSQTVEQFCARTGRRFVRFVFDQYATSQDFLGATGMTNGSTAFEPGPVLEAFTRPGAVCLLDEVSRCKPGALSALNAYLEPNARVDYSGQTWVRAAGNLFAAADNSLTQGDPTGRYAGVNQMDVAFGERFSFVIPMVYLDPATEAEALVRHTGCTRALADHVIAALTVCRSKVDSGDVIDAPSIRQAIAFILACSVLPVPEAWHEAIAARQPAESSVAIAGVYTTCIDADYIRGELQ